MATRPYVQEKAAVTKGLNADHLPSLWAFVHSFRDVRPWRQFTTLNVPNGRCLNEAKDGCTDVATVSKFHMQRKVLFSIM